MGLCAGGACRGYSANWLAGCPAGGCLQQNTQNPHYSSKRCTSLMLTPLGFDRENVFTVIIQHSAPFGVTPGQQNCSECALYRIHLICGCGMTDCLSGATG